MALLPGVLKNAFSFRRDKNSDIFYFRVKTEKWVTSFEERPSPIFFFYAGLTLRNDFLLITLNTIPNYEKVCVSKSEGFFFSIFFSFRIFQHCRHQAGHLHLTSPKRLFKVTCKMWISEQTRLNIWTVKNEGNLRVAFTRRNIEPLCGYFPTKSKSRRPVLMKRWS